MPRKTAAQKSRAATERSPQQQDESNASKPHRNGIKGGNAPPQPKKVKISHHSVTPLDSPPNPVEHAQKSNPQANDASEPRRPPGQVRTPPPAPPKSIPSDTVILPPEADDVKLRSQCDIHGLGVGVNSKMEDKIRQVLQALKNAEKDGKAIIVALSSPTKAANKCIGVAEIAKRELVKGKVTKVYQYTGSWTRLQTQSTQQRSKVQDLAKVPINKGEAASQDIAAAEDPNEHDEEAEESDNAFEEAEADERKKVRNAVCLVIYLAVQPIARLKELYGEQVHESDKH